MQTYGAIFPRLSQLAIHNQSFVNGMGANIATIKSHKCNFDVDVELCTVCGIFYVTKELACHGIVREFGDSFRPIERKAYIFVVS